MRDLGKTNHCFYLFNNKFKELCLLRLIVPTTHFSVHTYNKAVTKANQYNNYVFEHFNYTYYYYTLLIP